MLDGDKTYTKAKYLKFGCLYQNMQEETKNWWRQAQADIKTAKDNIASKNFYASVFFAQQAAEKSLKALYIQLNGSFPPKTHDLVELCRKVIAPQEVILVAGGLTITYLSSHYPGLAPKIPADFYNKEKAVSHLKEAKVILQWVKSRIK